MNVSSVPANNATTINVSQDTKTVPGTINLVDKSCLSQTSYIVNL